MKKLVLFLVSLSLSLFGKVYDKTSYYIAYDVSDSTQYALVMPAVSKVYTHKAGHVLPTDLTDITGQFVTFPTYNAGEVCFSQLKAVAGGSGGANVMAGNCYTDKFFYVQKEHVTGGYAFMLYYLPQEKLYEGLAGQPNTFKVVRSFDEVDNARSISGEDYTLFKFDIDQARILLGGDACDGDLNPVSGICEPSSSSSSMSSEMSSSSSSEASSEASSSSSSTGLETPPSVPDLNISTGSSSSTAIETPPAVPTI